MSDKEITVVFAEPALPILMKDESMSEDLKKSMSEDLKGGPAMDMVALSASSIVTKHLNRLDEPDLKGVMERFINNRVALKLNELTDYFNKSGFNVDSIDLNVAGKLGATLVVSAETTAGITFKITPQTPGESPVKT